MWTISQLALAAYSGRMAPRLAGSWPPWKAPATKRVTTPTIAETAPIRSKVRSSTAFLFPPLLIPPRAGSFAGYLFSSFGREFFGTGLPALFASEPTEFYRRWVLLFAHVVIIT